MGGDGKPRSPAFFDLTKRLHNLIHGSGDPRLDADDRALYERGEQRERRGSEGPRVRRDDILVIHDPQPLGMGALLKQRARDSRLLFRCHIGLDDETPETRAAWEFLRPYAERCDTPSSRRRSTSRPSWPGAPA